MLLFTSPSITESDKMLEWKSELSNFFCIFLDIKIYACHIKFPIGNYNEPILLLLNISKEHSMLVICGIMSF